MSNSLAIKAIYTAAYFREPSEQDSQYELTRIENNVSTTALLAIDSLLSREAEQYSYLAKLHLIFFDRLISSDEMKLWGNFLRWGLKMETIQDFFFESAEFANRLEESKSDIPKLLQDMVLAVSGQPLSADVASYYFKQFSDGELTAGDLLQVILGTSNDEYVANKLVTQALNDVSDLSLTESSKDSFELQISDVFSRYSTATTVELEPDLDEPTGTLNDDDLTALVDGSQIRPLDGNDTITLNDGEDVIVFESTSEFNGIDTIENFMLGNGGDQLDFSLFLNKVTTNLAATTIKDTSTDAQAWENGQVLVLATGSPLDSTELASFFGEAKPFAAPTEAAKAVLIAADITGHAYIHYLTNQDSVASIEPAELELVGILTDVNNLQLVPFSTANFA